MAVNEKASHRVSKAKKTVEKQDKTKSSVRRLKIKLVRSVIGHPRKQREVIKGLGLRKISSEVIREDCPEIRGMIRKISHLVSVEALEQK
jgi:large subunit ribosomal protein L30